jgi:hypothetical protein
MDWWVTFVIVVLVSAVFAFFEWRSWRKPLPRGLEYGSRVGQNDVMVHPLAHDFQRPRD